MQSSLFSGVDLRVPFPDKPVNAVPDRLGATRKPGTLFAKPEKTPEAQQASFTTPPAEHTAETLQPAIQRPREETREYTPLSLPTFHMLALDDKREIHYVPAIMTGFDATWNVAELRPLYTAAATDREHALQALQQHEDFSKEGEGVNDIQVFARPEEETRVKTAPLSYVQFITKAIQGDETVYLSGELQPSRTDPEVITLVGYSAGITPDHTTVYDLVQGQLRKNALEEEQVIQEDRPTIRHFLQAMRGSEARSGQQQAYRATRRRQTSVATG
ncbi:MAG: hypothetical protein ACYDER_16425 [Ktedonobacteraceae bacterium]